MDISSPLSDPSFDTSFYHNNLPDYTRLIVDNPISPDCNIDPPAPQIFLPIQTLQPRETISHPISSLTLLPDNFDILVSISSDAKIHDINYGRFLSAIPLPTSPVLPHSTPKGVCGIFTEVDSPLLILGLQTGDVDLYDLRLALKAPSIHVKGAHKGSISAICAGIPYNSNYIFTGGREDGWIKEFDLRFPYHIDSGLACPMQSLYNHKHLQFYNLEKENASHIEGSMEDLGMDGKDKNQDDDIITRALENKDGSSAIQHMEGKTIPNNPIRKESSQLESKSSSHHQDVELSRQSVNTYQPTVHIENKNLAADINQDVGILSMNISVDGTVLAASTRSGDCNLYRVCNVPLRRIKQWVLDDQSIFDDIKFTSNSSHILASSKSRRGNQFSGHLWDTINSNRSICLKTPGDGAPLYQHHFYLKEDHEKHTHNRYTKSHSRNDIIQHEQINKNPQSKRYLKNPLKLYTPESPYLENLHKQFWEQVTQPSSKTDLPVFRDLPAQHAAFYMDCGLSHPSYGRTDTYTVPFLCHPWGNLVVGTGGCNIYNGLHIWDGSSGLCLSTSSFLETQMTRITSVSAREKSNLFITGHIPSHDITNTFSDNKIRDKTSYITLWNINHLDTLLDMCIKDRMIDILVDPLS